MLNPPAGEVPATHLWIPSAAAPRRGARENRKSPGGRVDGGLRARRGRPGGLAHSVGSRSVSGRYWLGNSAMDSGLRTAPPAGGGAEVAVGCRFVQGRPRLWVSRGRQLGKG